MNRLSEKVRARHPGMPFPNYRIIPWRGAMIVCAVVETVKGSAGPHFLNCARSGAETCFPGSPGTLPYSARPTGRFRSGGSTP